MTPRTEGEIFEEQVRHIASCLWSNAGFANAQLVEGRERDAIFETDDVMYVVEATISRQKDKIDFDCQKTRDLIKKVRLIAPNKHVRGWIVTRHSPTAEQANVAANYKKYHIELISFEQFCAKLVNVTDYFNARMNHFFGSARNVTDFNDHANVGKYVPVSLHELDAQGERKGARSIDDVIQDAKKTGRRVVITGEYGAGKSMTLREIFLHLKRERERGETYRFPFYINLREHWGQDFPAEVLERHARHIGFAEPHQLVRAWRAGLAILLLDGFDELAAEGWTGRPERVREIRRKATKVVGALISETPPTTPVFVTGRSHYFDDIDELRTDLKIPQNARLFVIDDFSDDQIRAYLSQLKHEAPFPNWLPSRPLLIGYLASRKLLRAIGDAGESGPAKGWHSLLTMICERETALPKAEITGPELRAVMARVGTLARSTHSGLGPIEPEALFRAYEQIMGVKPGDAARPLLLRLPGLAGSDSDRAGARNFIDEDLAQAAAGIDMATFIKAGDTEGTGLDTLRHPLGRLGVEVAAIETQDRKISSKEISAAIRASSSKSLGILTVDCLRIAAEHGEPYRGPSLEIKHVEVPELDLEIEGDALAKVIFEGCMFDEIRIGFYADPSRSPRFLGCDIQTVVGRVGRRDLPEGLFDEHCHFENFSQFDPSTASIMRLQVPEPVKVLLTVLKKLFLQRGAGRRENAFFRGLQPAAQTYVANVLKIVESEGLALPTKQGGYTVWVPIRRAQQRVFEILERPSRTDDPALKKALALSRDS